jgi:hypothetical protein
VLFRADSFSHAGVVLRAMVGLGSRADTVPVEQWLTPYVALTLVAAAIGSVPWAPAVLRRLRARAVSAGAAVPRAVLAWGGLPASILLLFLCALKLAAGTHNPFIYSGSKRMAESFRTARAAGGGSRPGRALRRLPGCAVCRTVHRPRARSRHGAAQEKRRLNPLPELPRSRTDVEELPAQTRNLGAGPFRLPPPG